MEEKTEPLIYGPFLSEGLTHRLVLLLHRHPPPIFFRHSAPQPFLSKRLTHQIVLLLHQHPPAISPMHTVPQHKLHSSCTRSAIGLTAFNLPTKLQSTHVYLNKCNPTQLPQRVPKSFSYRGCQIPNSKPCICKRTHVMSMPGHLEHTPWQRHLISRRWPFTPASIIENNIEQDNFDYELDQQHIINTDANIVTDNNSPMNANLFCFAAFVNKHTGTIYNDRTGSFPFMSLKGNVCFLVVYHYKTIAILALPILGFSYEVIF
jgi:hypothetical protein